MIIADEALAHRVELVEARTGAASSAAFLARNGGGVPSEPLAGGLMNFGGVESPLTQAIGLAIGCSMSSEEFAQLEDFYFSREAAVAAFVTPFTSTSFTDHLAKEGYRVAEYNAVFARALASSDRLCSRRSDITVSRARSDELDDACAVAAGAFADEHVTAEVLVAMLRPMYEAEGMRVWIARIGGEIVGSATAYADDELRIAGLFGAATARDYRNRGVQAALLEERLSDAYNAGCELVMVSTLPGSASHRNVARRGFELLYNRFVMRREVPCR